jgi:hypothetical protein
MTVASTFRTATSRSSKEVALDARAALDAFRSIRNWNDLHHLKQFETV